jgi:hypothetical protein
MNLASEVAAWNPYLLDGCNLVLLPPEEGTLCDLAP